MSDVSDYYVNLSNFNLRQVSKKIHKFFQKKKTERHQDSVTVKLSGSTTVTHPIRTHKVAELEIMTEMTFKKSNNFVRKKQMRL